jgi:hypothetical protein
MLNKVLACCVVTMFLVCGFTGFALAEGKGPESVTLVDANSKKPKPAVFPHWKHQEKLKCEECHHTMTADGKQGPYEAGKEMKCAECHNSEKLAGKMKDKLDLATLKGAGHGNCLECHKANKNAKCTVCHQK